MPKPKKIQLIFLIYWFLLLYTMNNPLIFLASITSIAVIGTLGTHGLAQTKYVPTYYLKRIPQARGLATAPGSRLA